MLVGLAIRNIVLIEQLSLAFADGLTALTGETGAGKSIMLDALGLVLGARGDSTLLRHGADQASVTAAFELGPDHPARLLLREQGLDTEDTLVLRRMIGADGRSRAFVNDQPVGIGLLRQLGAGLAEIHGQFESQGLLDPRQHRALLDGFGRLQAAEVAEAWARWRALERDRTATEDAARRARADQDFLRHAVAELEALAPEPGEEERLAERRSMLMHHEKLVEGIAAALDEVAGDRSAARSLAQAQRSLQRVADKAGGRVEPVLAALDAAGDQLAEAAALLQRLTADLDLPPAELERLDERLFTLRAAARKHGVVVDDLAALRDQMAERLVLLDQQDDRLADLARQVAAARAAYLAAAGQLSAARKAAAIRLDDAVAAELAPLKLARARFATEVAPLAEADWGPAGTDRVTFLVATNPGAPLGPLNRIASGGEMARFSLALKVVLAEPGSVATLIFDEVDSGVGGAVADAVGERLARLGRSMQVLTVTHSPQVAARAAHHWRVEKHERGGTVTTTVVPLGPEERREEIARMLSGARITEQARAAADSLIAAGQ